MGKIYKTHMYLPGLVPYTSQAEMYHIYNNDSIRLF